MIYFKKNIIFLLLLFSFLMSENLQVLLTDVKSDKGYFLIVLVDSESIWKKVVGGDPLLESEVEQIIRKKVKVVKDKTQEIIFENIKKSDLTNGRYALTCYQDLNNDGKLARNWLGIPKEPVAVGNNAKGSFGPPSFEECRIFLKEKQNFVEIKLR